MEDMQIITLFLARNEDAIRHTDDTYGRRLYHLADGILRSGQDAEESVSDTYLKAWNTIPPRRPQHLFAYLAKICRNFSLDRLDWKNAAKRKAEVVSLTQEMELCIPDTQRERQRDGKELGMLLDAFLRTLTPEMLRIRGRHDPCIVPRAVPCIEAAAAIAIYDALLGQS